VSARCRVIPTVAGPEDQLQIKTGSNKSGTMKPTRNVSLVLVVSPLNPRHASLFIPIVLTIVA